MKRIRPRTLLALSALLLTAVVVMSPVFAGGGAGCGSKASATNSAICPPGCCPCPEAQCGDVCSGAADCTWDQSHWKGLKYSPDGQLKQNLTERQARSIARQYLKKVGAAKGRVVSVIENPNCYNVCIELPGTNSVQKYDVSKKTAWIRPLDA